MTTGLCLHIGFDRVHPAATDMTGIARALGYDSVALQDSEATSDRVIAEVEKAARVLERGDIFLLVLWDRQLLDAEARALWSRFREGVRIFVLSDRGQSVTASRTMVLPKLAA